jgi:predicted metal-dependent phosphoesterase TrpH
MNFSQSNPEPDVKVSAGEKQIEHLAPEQVEVIQQAGAVPSPGGSPEPGKMKIDLHCHSEASADCSTPLALIEPRCQARGVRVQAITDHNLIWGAQKLKEMVAAGARDSNPQLTIIIGEEVSTTEGEIVGLFLKETIPAGLTPEATVERIKAQGGLVLVPHGFDPLKRYRLRPAALERIAKWVDIVETFNARISRPRWNRAAVAWAQSHRLPMSAGSDAHTLADIGSAWVEVPRSMIKGPQDLLDALCYGTPVGLWTHPVLAFAKKMWDRTRRRWEAADLR